MISMLMTRSLSFPCQSVAKAGVFHVLLVSWLFCSYVGLYVLHQVFAEYVLFQLVAIKLAKAFFKPYVTR